MDDAVRTDAEVRRTSLPATPADALRPGWLARLARRMSGPASRFLGSMSRQASRRRLARLGVNLAGAVFAAFFARASILFYLQSHRLIGVLFFVEQAWFVVANLIRRPPRTVSDRPASWLLAAAGTFGGLLLRPQGAHPPWGVATGFVLQLLGLALALASLAALGRSFGFVAADRGLVTRGPYAVVRHPVYAAYVLIQCGYVLQAVSVRNVVVLVLAIACNVGRAISEERVLAQNPDYAAYRRRVRRRLLPGVW